mgnify:CR=1 FL=1
MCVSDDRRLTRTWITVPLSGSATFAAVSERWGSLHVCLSTLTVVYVDNAEREE